MKYWSLLICAIALSCNGESDATDSDTVIADDTTGSAVVEHELDDERLDAVGYNNRLNSILSSSLNDIDLVFGADSASVNADLENVLFNLDLNHTAIVETTEFTKDEPFRLAVLELLAFYINELNGGFAETVVPIIAAGTFSHAEEETLVTYDETFVEAEKVIFDKVLSAQEAFAKENNIRLEE